MTEEKDQQLQSHAHGEDDGKDTPTSSPATSPPAASTAPFPSSSFCDGEVQRDPFDKMVEKSTEEAEAAKLRGNVHFGKKEYEEAIACYSEAILLCPESAPQLLSTVHSNRAAAHLQLQRWPDAVADCTASLSLQPSTKALLRRATAYEREDKLVEAIADVKAVLARGDGGREEESRLRRLEAAKRDRDERMKDEMLGKLKELGNGLLGKFGMSLDNFKAVKDDKTGSYSISINK